MEAADFRAEQRQDVIATMKQLAPAMIAAGLHKHAIFKNNIVQQLLKEYSIKS